MIDEKQKVAGKLSVDFQPIGKRAYITPGETVLDASQSSGVGLASVCGGSGTCEECKIIIISGSLIPPTKLEEISISSDLMEAGWRLACQAIPLTDVKVSIPPESMTTNQRLQFDGEDTELFRDLRVVDPGLFGLAIDVGTTKVALYLINLFSGKTIAKDGFMNPQIAYGEDVISRLSYAERVPGGAELLQKILFESINKLLVTLCARAGINVSQVGNVVLVGNTAMHHFAAGLPVKQLGYAPFAPASVEPILRPAAQLGLIIPGNAQVYFPPVIAGYVGSDHLAMLISLEDKLQLSRIMQSDLTKSPSEHEKVEHPEARNIIALDIGTNTEISLISGKEITCCSCASGPAFEGAHIYEGMRASPGAIERTSWKDGKLLWQTIDSQPPVGICGSGILDIIASLLEGNIIKSSGQLRDGNSFPVVRALETGLGRDIIITRKDIHEVQLAKSAIRTAIDLLLQHAGLVYADLDEFIVAGAFGTYLDSKNAIRIGMFPPVDQKIIRQIGNAAGMGAKRMLLSSQASNNAESLAKSIRYLELATRREFQDVFINNLIFK
jgi:uncharacterized 2Fe-2S/4Fe-4S cluster protein (DUF4445 family)